MKALLGKLVRQNLSQADMQQCFAIMLRGEASPEQIAGFISALATRGESAEDVIIGVTELMKHATIIAAPDHAMDIVGTGGDGIGTWNISTAASFVVAGAGFPVAKHGNVAVSSKSGAAEVLSQLGINLDADMTHVQAALDEIGICFLMAPRHHSVMRHVGPVRAALGFRSIFNMMGPLSNPAEVKRFMMGVFASELLEPYAHAMLGLGVTHALVVHGSDGLDEVTTTGETHAMLIRDGKATSMTLHPSDIGLPVANIADLVGGTPDENGAAMRAIFSGTENAYRDIVIFNAAAALFGAGHVDNLIKGRDIAVESMESGAALTKLDQLVAVTNREDEK